MRWLNVSQKLSNAKLFFLLIEWPSLKKKTVEFSEQWRNFIPNQPTQGGYQPWSDKVLLPALQTVNLINKEKSAVPAQIVFFSIPGENRHYPPSDTTGMATHYELDKAIVTGVMELIEKTSIVTSWLTQTPAKRLNINNFDCLNDGLTAANERQLTVRIFDVSLFPEISVCFALVQSSRDDFHYAVGASASVNTMDAAKKALNEAIQTYDSYKQYFFDPAVCVETARGQVGVCLRAASRQGFERHYGYLDVPCQEAPIYTRKNGLACLDILTKYLTELHVFSFPTMKNARLRTVRVISPELLWSLPALNGDLPAARRYVLAPMSVASTRACHEPIPFP